LGGFHWIQFMARSLITLAAVALLSACAPFPEWAGSLSLLSVHNAGEAGRYSFDWTLSGDRAVAPVQVFDNGRQTWLQFQPGQAVPAIFAITDQGERPLHYARQGDYVII